jgi:hypothetical protein
MRRRHSHIFEREHYDHYVEPLWCSRRLFETQATGTIADPACGWGRILRSARSESYQVIGVDLIDRERRPGFIPFSAPNSCGADSHCAQPACFQILPPLFGSHSPSPPWRSMRRRWRLLVPPGLLLAAHWLKHCPLKLVLALLLIPRPSIPSGEHISNGGKVGGGTADFCWLIFQHGYRGPRKSSRCKERATEMRDVTDLIRSDTQMRILVANSLAVICVRTPEVQAADNIHWHCGCCSVKINELKEVLSDTRPALIEIIEPEEGDRQGTYSLFEHLGGHGHNVQILQVHNHFENVLELWFDELRQGAQRH